MLFIVTLATPCVVVRFVVKQDIYHSSALFVIRFMFSPTSKNGDVFILLGDVVRCTVYIYMYIYICFGPPETFCIMLRCYKVEKKKNREQKINKNKNKIISFVVFSSVTEEGRKCCI